MNGTWAEQLPSDCPPSEASAPQGEEYFRLVTQLPLVLDDFVSQRQQFPDTIFRVGECIARAVSVFRVAQDCAAQRKWPRHRNKHVVVLRLTPSSGAIQQTFTPSHHSWWRAEGFDPVAASQPVSI